MNGKQSRIPEEGEAQGLTETLIEALNDFRFVARGLLAEHRNDKHWVWFRRILFIVAILMFGAFYVTVWGGAFGWRPEPTSRAVGIVRIQGTLSDGALANADRIVPLIRSACRDTKIQGVILLIDSPGGSPTEAERIVTSLKHCRPADGDAKPVYAVIQNMGASAAYLIAVHADRIYANQFAMVGSIGAIMSRLEYSEGLERLGVRGKVYASAPLKSMFSNMGPDSDDQAKAVQELVDGAANVFEAMVQERRGEKLVGSADVVFSGRVWVAGTASDLGLIDGIAVIDDVIEEHFAGLRTHYYSPKRTIQDRLEISALVDAVADAVVMRLGSESIEIR
jgi:protease IV